MGDYVRKTWQPNAEGGTPINAASLNNIEEGIESAHTEINEIKIVVDKISPFYVQACDLKNIIKTITVSYDNYETSKKTGSTTEYSKSWTAAKDCWVGFTATGVSFEDEYGNLKIDGIEIAHYELSSGYSEQNGKAVFPPFFIKSGAVVTVTSARFATAIATIYDCLS